MKRTSCRGKDARCNPDYFRMIKTGDDINIEPESEICQAALVTFVTIADRMLDTAGHYPLELCARGVEGLLSGGC